jgi:ferrous iron transport protein B
MIQSTAAPSAAAASMTVALAGNPNAGKTTLFNFLTGLRQKVANYPGVTVEWRSGEWQTAESRVTLIDLPGLYSLETTSIDESIARTVLEGGVAGVSRPDVIVAVVDATNLERNLYLVTQLFDFGIPVVVALTMMDTFEKRKHALDTAKMSKLLGVPVVEMNAAKGQGNSELWDAVLSVAGTMPKFPLHAGDQETESENARIFSRYNFISGVVQASVKHYDRDAHRFSERLDKVLTHKVFGLAILVGVLLLVFQAIFTWAAVPMELLEQGFGWFGDLLRARMSQGILADLAVDGIVAGVGGVLIFLPQILLLFLFISILEDTGYMSRAAFLLDRLMSRVGLHGKAFLPLMSSFACAIPGIMATRTIENSRDRFATILIAPLMSCSARLPVYTLMIGAFFSGQVVFGFLSIGAVLMLAMYVLGITVAVIVAFVLKRTVLKSDPAPFIMELPPYRVPNVRTILQNMYLRAWMFVKRAGTVILAISIILWGLMYFPRSADNASINQVEVPNGGAPLPESVQLQNSYAGRLGHAIEPLIRPLGYDWKIGVALIASFAAREVLVSTLSIIYNVGKDENEESDSLIGAVRNARRPDGTLAWTPLTALSLMVFFVLAMQCMSTLAIVRRETNSWRWPLFMLGYMTVLAYVGALITYQGGRLLGLQ